MLQGPYHECPLCAHYGACLHDGFERQQPLKACFEDRRTHDIGRLEAHFRWIESVEETPARLSASDFGRLFDPVGKAQGRMSRPLEFSVAYGKRSEHWMRCSVAYADRRPDALEADLAHLTETLALAGVDGVQPLLARLSPLDPSLVLQLLYGFDLRPGGQGRQKAYFRMAEGQPQAKARFLDRLVPGLGPSSPVLPFETLRLVGVDFPSGGTDLLVKLYYGCSGMSVASVRERTGPHAFLDFLADRIDRVDEVLFIERIGPGGRSGAGRIEEIDVHLLKNGLGISELLRYVKEAKLDLPLRRLVERRRETPLVLTSVTVSLSDPHKMNVYYLLA